MSRSLFLVKSGFAIATTALLFGISVPASALDFRFNFNDATTGFECGALAPAASAAQMACAGPINDKIEWRLADNPRSSLELNDNINPLITVGGGFVVISHITHTNNVIGSPFQFFGNVHSSTRVTSSDGAATFRTEEIDTPFEFLETLNAPPCPDPNPNGSTCDDKFTIDLSGFLAPAKFVADGVTYSLSFTLAENPANGTTFCTINGNFGICTDEGDIHGVDFLARIDEMPMPEPGSIALLGIGLLGLFGASRKYMRKS